MIGDLATLQFAGQAYTSRSPDAINDVCVNLYQETNPPRAKSKVSILGTPGLKPWAVVGPGPIRGAQRMVEELYVVSGEELWVVTRFKRATLLGVIKGAGAVSMTTNGTHVVIAAHKHFYAANRAEVLALPDQYIRSVGYQDGYVIAVPQEGPGGTNNEFIISALDDATTWSALDFSSADVHEDFIVGMVSDHRELWIFKQRSTEIWVNTGNPLFPFERIGSGFIERGCASSKSITKTNNLPIWVGDDYRVYAASGYQPRPISTPYVEHVLQSTASPESIWSFTYEQGGHTFYVLTTPGSTFAYDIKEDRWHRRQSPGLARWRGQAYQKIWGQHMVGDFESGDVYTLDLLWPYDKGETIVRRATLPQLSGGKMLFTMSELRIDMETGIGISIGEYATVVNYAGLAGASITVTYDGIATTKTEGTDFDAAVSNRETAKRIAAAFAGVLGYIVVPNAERVLVIPDGDKGLALASSDATDLPITAGPLQPNPGVRIDFSEDGGLTYGNPTVIGAGTEGSRDTTVEMHRCGAFRSRVSRVTVADPVSLMALHGAQARLRRLES